METEILTGGLERVWTDGSMAVVVLMICLIISLAANFFLIRLLLPFRDVLTELKILMNFIYDFFKDGDKS